MIFSVTLLAISIWLISLVVVGAVSYYAGVTTREERRRHLDAVTKRLESLAGRGE